MDLGDGLDGDSPMMSQNQNLLPFSQSPLGLGNANSNANPAVSAGMGMGMGGVLHSPEIKAAPIKTPGVANGIGAINGIGIGAIGGVGGVGGVGGGAGEPDRVKQVLSAIIARRRSMAM